MLPSNDAFLLPGSGEATRAWAAAPDTVGLAEAASFMVEWHALAARTGNASYAVTADHVVHLLQQRHPKQVCKPFSEGCFEGSPTELSSSIMHLIASLVADAGICGEAQHRAHSIS